MDIKRFFEILELDRNASLDEAKQAYKDMVNIWHPDRFSNNPRLKRKAEEKLKEANLAYEMVRSFLTSPKEARPGQEKAPKSQAEAGARDKTEAVVEAGTRIILSVCYYLYTSLRGIIVSQPPKPGADKKAKGEPEKEQRQCQGKRRGQK
ncbi:MAG: DnaJ domain-containing protein [Deltaproteobacteria bacterium]|nr:MAG: DnaJ domain-containing protein [Deltaproteobacteria bacterium]